MASIIAAGVILAGVIALLGDPVRQRATTLGIGRGHIVNDHGSQLKIIPNTIACEDLHYDSKSNRLYTACQGDLDVRSSWFPPNLVFDHSKSNHQGQLVVINPETFESTSLRLEGFSGPLIPHGIDIYTDDPHSTYIFVINHLANPQYYNAKATSTNKGLDSVEVFKHEVGVSSARFVRSVKHPLLRTTNDIVAGSTTSFYITNDHYHREGFMRQVEEVGEYHSAAWSDISYVEFDAAKSDFDGVSAKTALTGLHNNNGLANGRPGYPEIIINDAGGGRMYRARIETNNTLKVIEGIQLDSALDNPFYFEDLYATSAGGNASGYILPGYPRAYAFFSDFPYPERAIPSMVWHLRSHGTDTIFENEHNEWEHRILFQDDGNLMRGASGAVLLGIDPAKTGGKKQGWLYVCGVSSRCCVALKVDI